MSLADNEEDYRLFDFFYNQKNMEDNVKNQNKENLRSLNELLDISFTRNLIPLNHIIIDENYKVDENIITLSKFKELNLNKVNEDMLYYCSPVDILSKLDSNNSQYLVLESDSEFFNDLSIKTFLQRQNELTDILNSDTTESLTIVKKKKLEILKNSFNENQTKIKKIDELYEINNLIKLIQNSMSILLKEKNEDIILNSLNEIILILKKENFELNFIGNELYILIENNLIFLFGLIEKKFNKNEEFFGKLIGVFIDIYNSLKSNRLFFMIIQLLNKYKNISAKIKYDKNRQMISDKSIDLKSLINSNEINKKINIEDIKQFLISKGYEINEKNDSNEDNFWIVNNRDELFIFSNEPNNKNIFYYKVNIREEEYILENTYDLIDFGKIILSNIDDDLIFDINISIKNDLIYMCYLVNQKLNKNDDAQFKFEFSLFFKIFSTSMILLKEGSIKLNNFACLNSYLYSDQNYLYVLSENNKIFVLNKNYSMDNYVYSDYIINSNNNDISINEYKYHNCFNLNNLILLENKNDKEELILVNISKRNNKYILNIINMHNSIIEKSQDGHRKTKISYNDNNFIAIIIDTDNISCSKPDFNINNFINIGIQFLPFDNSSINYNYKNIFNDNNCIYKDLLQEYSNIVNLYGNFDIIDDKEKSENILLSYPYSLCFNVNTNNFNFIIDQILSKDVDMEIKMYYFIIIKQYICCLYNTNILKIEQIQKLIEYMKQFILDIPINYKNNINKKYINKILREIIYISSYLNEKNIIEINDLVNSIKEKNEIDYKTKLLLLDLLFTQPKTQQSLDLFNFILEFDKSFLLNIFIYEKNKEKETKNNLLTTNYKLYKNIMNKAFVLMDNYFADNIREMELFSLTEKITKNIEEICKLYKEMMDSEICGLPLFFHSINFTFLYFILQRLISSESINKNMNILSCLYNVLLILDNLNINKKLEESLDLNNLIEIKNFYLENEENIENNNINTINFNSKQNIIFKTNITDAKNTNDYMRINLIKKEKNKSIEINLNEIYDYIHYDVDGIEVIFKNINVRHNIFILNVIPVKNDNEYIKNKKNENFKIINLIQKTILHYFLFLLNKIDEKINNFNKEQNVKNFCKLYHTEFLQFICTNNIDINIDDKNKNENENGQESIISKCIELNNDINNLFEESKENEEEEKNEEKDKNQKKPPKSSTSFINDIISIFGKLNKNEAYTLYKKDDKTLQKILSYKDIITSDSSFTKLIELFNSEISKKNRILYSMQSNESINKMILKIFQIIIKYYNFNSKLYNLIEDINKSRTNEDYKLFCDIYEECCQIKMVYNQEKSRFVDVKFEEQSQNYINKTMEKLDFIYKIIIPSFDETLKYDKSTMKNLFDLIKNEKFNPKEIIKYSEIQNLNCNIKLIQFLIINNLLINLKEEENLKFLLYIINDKYNKNDEANYYSISMSLFDSIYGADFSQMDQVKNQFHLFIDIIIDKYILNNKNYETLSLSTKISLYQSLLWKYKGRDFNILPKIINCFEDIKKYEISEENNNDILFKLNYDKNYRINIFNLRAFNYMKFEIFKIITSQIFLKIKDTLNNRNIKEIDSKLNLTRNISNINNYKNIISLVLSYFSFIKKNNKYYHEFILFFYKNIINCIKLIELIIDSYPEVIIKIFDIIFDKNNIINNNQIFKTKLIVLKLLFQILENVNNEDKINCLIDCCIQYNKEECNKLNYNEELNPFVFIMTKFNLLLNKEENEILKYYYFKIFLFCLNKIDIEKYNIDKSNLLNINLLLSTNNNISKIESKFNMKNEYGCEFEDNALFCHLESNKILKSGSLLCYIDKESLFNDYLTKNDIKYFNSNDFVYNFEQNKNSEFIFAIMDESLDGKINKIKCIEKRNIEDITLIDDKKSNLFYSKYLQNNSAYIYDNLINKLIEKKLNYK